MGFKLLLRFSGARLGSPYKTVLSEKGLYMQKTLYAGPVLKYEVCDLKEMNAMQNESVEKIEKELQEVDNEVEDDQSKNPKRKNFAKLYGDDKSSENECDLSGKTSGTPTREEGRDI